MSIKDYFPTEEQRLRARAFIVEAAAWIAVIAVLTYRFLVLAYDFFCDKMLPLIPIIFTHAVLAWEDYKVGRTEYRLTEYPAETIARNIGHRTTARGFK